MESEESRREQLSGSASHGGGKVCNRCGFVYPNPHPSKKHRKAHQKHCSAAASKPPYDAADVAGAMDVNMAHCEPLADEDPLIETREVVMDESKPEVEVGRQMGQSGGDSEELCKDAILEDDNVDTSPGSCALHHGNKGQSSDVGSTRNQLDDSTHLKNHSVSCGVDMVCPTEDAKVSSHFPLTKASCLDAAKEEMCCSTVQNVVDTATSVNYISNGNYGEDKSDGDICKELNLSHDLSSDSSLVDSELQKKEKYMESSVTVDQGSTVTMLMSDLLHEVSANRMEPDSFIFDAEDVETDVAGQMFQVQPSCKDGQCTLESNGSELFDISTDSSKHEYLIGNCANCSVNGNEPEDWHILPVESTTLLAEVSDVKPGYLEDCGFNAEDVKTDVVGQMSQVQPSCEDEPCTLENNACKPNNSTVNGNEFEDCHNLPVASTTLLVDVSEVTLGSLEDCGLGEPDLTIIRANTEVGSDIGRHLVDEVAKVVPPELSLMEFDKNTTDIPSAFSANEDLFLHKDKVNAVNAKELNYDQNCEDVNSDRSQLVNEFECEIGVSTVKFQVPEEEPDCLGTHKLVASVGSQVGQAMDIDGQVNSSCETCYPSPELEAQKVDYLSEGQDAYLPCEGYLADNLRVVDSGVAVSGLSKFNETSEISNESQIVRQEATQLDNDVLVEEKKHEMVKEENSYMDPKIDSQPRCYVSELVPPSGGNIERSELQDNECVMNSTHEDNNFRYLESNSDYCLDQQGVHGSLEDRFKQAAAVDETIYPDRHAEPCILEAIAEHGIPGEHYHKLDLYKDETDNAEIVSGFQLELQNLPEVRSVDPLSSDEKKPDYSSVKKIDAHPPSVDNENNLANIHNEEPNSNESREVNLSHDDGENLKTEECSSSKVDMQSFLGETASDYDSRTSDAPGIASSSLCQSMKEEDVHLQSMQQTDFYIGKIDHSFNSNSQTGSMEALWGSVSDGAIPSLRHAAKEECNFNAKAPPPTDSLSTKDLHTSDLAAAGALCQSNVDNSDILGEPSLTTLVGPGRHSVSLQNKHGERSINEENSAKVLNSNSGKPHVMLKNLLAEANLESKQKASTGRGHESSSTPKRSWGLQDDGHSLKTATPKLVSAKSNEPLDKQADHKEWNSPARLPVAKHEKKKVKARQAWVPFICCPSMN